MLLMGIYCMYDDYLDWKNRFTGSKLYNYMHLLFLTVGVIKLIMFSNGNR